MGMIDRVLGGLFGGGGNVIVETAEVFRENAEAGARREHDQRAAVLAQFAAEFAQAQKSPFDRAIDGINRLPRPMLALGTIALFISAMSDPVWFAARMEGVALIPEPLWWLMGAIVSFYFGSRYQVKAQNFQRAVAQSVAAGFAMRPAPSEGQDGNAALEDWRAAHGG